MKKLILLLLVIVCCSCGSLHTVKMKDKDGKTVKVKYPHEDKTYLLETFFIMMVLINMFIYTDKEI